MAVFIITTLLMVGYLVNLVIFAFILTVSTDTGKRTNALLSIIFTLAGMAGVLYLAAH